MYNTFDANVPDKSIVSFDFTSGRLCAAKNPATFKLYQNVVNDDASDANDDNNSNNDSNDGSVVKQQITQMLINKATGIPVTSTLRDIAIPIKGNPVNVRVDNTGLGVLGNEWNIFSYPKASVPYKTPFLISENLIVNFAMKNSAAVITAQAPTT